MQDTNNTKTITLKIHSQDFDITIQDDFGLTSNISRLELLRAYVRANYEVFQMEVNLKK